MKIRYAAAGLILAVLSAPALAGPISKYDRRTPDADFVSPGNIFDIERCLTDMENLGGTPLVYGQPDKPDERRLIWLNDEHSASVRIDLRRVENGTYVKSWQARSENQKGFDACVPPSIQLQGSGSR